MSADRLLAVFVSVLLAAGASGCGGSEGDGTESAMELKGAGSSLVEPLVGAWTPEFEDHSGIVVTYTGIGSGGGIQAITTRTVDFGASDAPLTPDQANACKDCVQVPWALSATTVSYNLPGTKALKLSGPVVADVFLGRITRWSDPRITSLNPGLKLPAKDITVVYRSDGSGDTYAFSSYLSKVSPDWMSQVGTGTTVNFPSGVGSRGNSGVAGTISRTEGAVGYISVAYAVENDLAVASVQNRAGQFVAPEIPGIAAAAAAMPPPAADNSISIVDPPASAPAAYPISTFTYAIVPKGAQKAAALESFLEYAIGPGQELAPTYVFAKLPAEVVALDKTAIATIR